MSPRRIRRSFALLVIGLLLVGASAASAATFCVGDPGCPATGMAEPTIAAALDAANAAPGRDRIQIGPGTYAEAGLVDPPDSPIDVVGAGMSATSIGAPGAVDASTLDVQDQGSTISDLTVLLPDKPDVVGLRLAGTSSRVAVSAPPESTGTGVELGPGATFVDGSVTASGGTGVAALYGLNAGTVEDSNITAWIGVENVVALRRVRIVAASGVRASGPVTSNMTLDDVLIHIRPDAVGVIGIDATASNGAGVAASATLTARHVTIVGNGAPGAIGVEAYAAGWYSSFPTTASMDLTGVILRGFTTDLARGAIGGPGAGTANLTIDYSDYDPAKRWDTNYPGGAGSITEGPHNLNVDPLFTDPSTGDFSLQGGSPLIDRAEPPPLAPDEPTTDLASNPRVVDGDGDRIAISDIGAFEYQPSTPPAPAPLPPLTLTGLHVSPQRFAVAPGTTAASASKRRSKRAPRGTRIHFALSRAAVVTFTIVQPRAGHRSVTHCIAPSRRLRGAKRCDLTIYAFTRHGNSGVNAIPFSGRIGRRGHTPLAAGHYVLLASLAAGISRHAHFTVVER